MVEWVAVKSFPYTPITCEPIDGALANQLCVNVVTSWPWSIELTRSGGGKGAKGALCRGGIWRGKNMKFLNLAASGELAFALQTVILYTP